MKALMGIGNDLNGDDGVGPYIAGHLQHDDWTCYDCGTAPENFTGVIRNLQPEQLVLVDAADMGVTPGEIRIIPRDRIEDTGIGTHMLPLYHIVDYLHTAVEHITVIGIQPLQTHPDHPLSEPVQAAADRLVDRLKTGRLAELSELEPET